MHDELGLYHYAAKRFGEIHLERTITKFRLDLEHYAHLLHNHRSDRPILEYFKMTLALNIDTLFNEELTKHGGLTALSNGKSIEALTKWFKDLLTENAKTWAEEEKKKTEAAKNRRKNIYKVFTELDHHTTENELIAGVLMTSPVPLKEMEATKLAIKAELDLMGEEQKVAWVKEGGAGVVLLESEKGEDVELISAMIKDKKIKVQNFRPLRGRAASKK